MRPRIEGIFCAHITGDIASQGQTNIMKRIIFAVISKTKDPIGCHVTIIGNNLLTLTQIGRKAEASSDRAITLALKPIELGSRIKKDTGLTKKVTKFWIGWAIDDRDIKGKIMDKRKRKPIRWLAIVARVARKAE